jgi:hypothetical protein
MWISYDYIAYIEVTSVLIPPIMNGFFNGFDIAVLSKWILLMLFDYNIVLQAIKY